MIEDILRKSDGVCAHCGCPVAIGDNFTVEHVVPISKGGTNDLVNIDKYFHDKRWFTHNNFCQVDFKKIEVNIPFAGKQKTLRKGDQTLLARRYTTCK